jgi:predicted negative regulator of RcsB-dependent stress response
MRRIWCIGSLLAAVFMVACNSNKQVPEPVEGPSPALSSVDSLMWVQPDSALACLLPYFDTCCRDGVHTVSTYNRHYAHLLLAELLYKNDYDQTNRAELLDAVTYFDSLTLNLNDHPHAFWRHCGLDSQSPDRDNTLFFLDARAHYINGVGYYEHDSVVPACKEYLKALEVMEEHFEEEELVGKKAKFIALTHSHLVELFSNLYLPEQAIYFGKESLKYYQKHNAEPWHIAWTLNHIGGEYNVLRDYDSAYYYYNKGLNILTDTTSMMYRDIMISLAILSYWERRTGEESINQMKVVLSNANSVKEYYSRCLSIGETYYKERQFDSAGFYLKKVFENTQNEESKKLAAQRLVEIYKAQGKELEAMEYADFLVPFATKGENQSGIKSQLTEQYKNHVQSRLERERQKEKMKSQRWTIVLAVSLLILMLFIVILYHRNKRKKQHLETQIAAERHSHQIQQDALSGKLKQKNQEVRKLQDQIKQQNDSDAETEPTLSFVEEPICRLIMERVKEGQFKSQMDCSIYKDFALSKEQLIALHGAANRHFSHFTERLAQAYPDLTKNDLDYCCLYLLGLTDADIAALMQRAYNTVNERNSKLRRIFGCKSTISVTLQAIANETTTVTTTDYQVVS